jgi:transposase-like protein
MRGWIDRSRSTRAAARGVSSEVALELRRLRRENAKLRRASEILRTASAPFAAEELDRRLK